MCLLRYVRSSLQPSTSGLRVFVLTDQLRRIPSRPTHQKPRYTVTPVPLLAWYPQRPVYVSVARTVQLYPGYDCKLVYD
jgi:hypothetical protein